jgi:hypothetical protein
MTSSVMIVLITMMRPSIDHPRRIVLIRNATAAINIIAVTVVAMTGLI